MDFQGQWTFSFPTLVRFGVKVSEELGPFLKAEGKRAPLLVTDPMLKDMPFIKKIVKDLATSGLGVTVFSETHKNPIRADVEAGAKAFHGASCDSVIGIGGGVSMDVARAICLRVHHEGDLFSYQDGVGDHLITKEIPFFVTVPTTSGTGSEVGRSAVISDDITHEKKILFSPRLLAKRVFADPLLTMDLPPFITAATGMDALTHNIEAYLARGFHPMAEGIAQEGMRLAAQHLENAVNHPDLYARAGMMMASLMGAVAFQKGLGVVHSCAHALSILFDTHHGLSNALMLSYGMEFNQSVCGEKFLRMQEIFQTEDIPAHFRRLNQKVGMPLRLTEVGIKDPSSQIDNLAATALADFCHPSNPRAPSLQDFRELFRKAL